MSNDDVPSKSIYSLLAILVLLIAWKSCFVSPTDNKKNDFCIKTIASTKAAIQTRIQEVKSAQELPPDIDIVDRRTMAEWAIQDYLKDDESRALRNPYNASNPIHIFGKQGPTIGAIYVDCSSVDPQSGGDIIFSCTMSGFFGNTHIMRELLTIDFDPPSRGKSVQERIKKAIRDQQEWNQSIPRYQN